MLTIDDIRNVQFNKGRGYRAEDVDEFIDECVATVAQLQQEAREANQKAKILADKVAEYRNDEDAIRAALLSAQRAADAVLHEAEEKAKALISDAKVSADALRQDLMAQAQQEAAELERAKNEVEAFKKSLLVMYKQHLSVLGLLTVEPEEPQPKVEQPVAEEVQTVEEPQPIDEPQPSAPVVSQPAVSEEVVVLPGMDESMAEEVEEQPLKPLSRYADLKFGNDYDIHTDTDDDDVDRPSRGLFRKKK